MSEYAKSNLPQFNELPEGIVTFLFSDIEGSTQLLHQLGNRYAELLAEHHHIIRKSIANWRGQEVGTEGDSFFIVFPHAKQAVNAVVEVQHTLAKHHWPQDVEVRVRMGLHTGEPLKSKEGYIGIDVHRAARIAHIGHGGQVLLSETTEALARDELPHGVNLLDLGTYRLKDMRKPDQIFQLVIDGLPAEFPPLSSLEMHLPKISLDIEDISLPVFLEDVIEEAPAPKFVRRERELQRLDQHLSKVMAGEGQVVFITGGAGRGKTALVEEFTQRAMKAHSDLLVVSGNCNSYFGIGDPYHPFREIFSQLIGDLETQIVKGVLSRDHVLRLWRALPIVLSTLMKRGPDLFNVLFASDILLSNATTALSGNNVHIQKLRQLVRRQIDVSAEMKQTHLFGQCANVLDLLAFEYPLMLVLDDLQWADAASTGLLFHLGQRLNRSRILIVGTFRSDEIAMGMEGDRHPLDSVINEFKRKYGDIIVDLDWVNHTEGRKFVDAYLDTESNKLGDEFRLAFFKQTEGHALFTVELFRDMQERGALLKDQSGDWIIGPSIDWDTLPKRPEGAIAERIDRLEEPLQEILQVACVEGVDFTAQVISGVLDIEMGQITQILSRELIQRHRLIIEKEERLIGKQKLSYYGFTHILFQRYLYNQIGSGERRLLHSKVAEGMEAVYQDQLDEIAIQLANHFDVAGNTNKTAKYLHLAGERALRQYAYHEAIDHLTQALESTSNKEATQQGMIYSLLGLAYRGVGNFPECRKHLYQALTLLDRPMPDTPGKLIRGLIRQLIKQSLQRLLPGIFIANQVSDEKRKIFLETVRIHSILAYIFYFANESLSTIYSTLRMLNLAEQAGPSPELARAYANMCISAGLVPLNKLAESYGDQAFKVARYLKHLPTLINISIVITAYKSGVGQWAEVRGILDESREICEQIGDYRQWSECTGILTCCVVLEGNFSRGIELGNLIGDRARDHNNILHQAWGLEWLALCNLRIGQNETACHQLEKALSYLSDNAERTAEIENYGMLALARLRTGKLEEARQAADKTAERIAQAGPPSMYSMIIGYAGMTEVYLQLWKDALSNKSQTHSESIVLRQLARQACKYMHAYKRVFPIGQPYAWLYQGRYDWLKGKRRKAHKAWQKSLAAGQHLKMPYEIGLAHYEIGRYTLNTDPARKEHLKQAVELFSQLGANYDLEQATIEMKKTRDP